MVTELCSKCQNRLLAFLVAQLTFLWIIFIMIVAGNSAVLIALLLSKNRKSRMNFFIMHLAIADLTVGLINVLSDIIWRTTIAFYGDNFTCKLVKYLQVLVTYSSTYVLVALSVDRYDAIAHPMNFSSGWRKAKILVASAWGLSAVFSLPSVFISSHQEINGVPQCWIDFEPWQWQLYISLVAVSLFFIPAFIIAACYTVIVYTIWTKSRLMSYPKISSKSSSIVGDSKKSTVSKEKSTTSSAESEADRKRASSRGIIPRAKIKTVKMTLVIVLVFVFCWSPYFVYDLLQVYGMIPDGQMAISTFIQSLAPLNSAANPIIYCLFSTHICGNFRRLACCNWFGRKFCFCFSLVHRPLSESQSRASEYTTMTETMSYRNSTLHQPISMYRSPRSLGKQVSNNSTQDQRKGVMFQDTPSINNVGNSGV